MENQIYIQSKGKVEAYKNKTLFIKDLVDIYADSKVKEEIESIEYPLQSKGLKKTMVISVLAIIQLIKEKDSEIIIMVLGQPDILINLQEESNKKDKFKILRLAFVTLLLFVGSMTAIINFHADVDMKAAHKTMYHIITGEEKDRPLLLQIPYSIGIGVGMSVFFNHIFKKRINTEPSPLEVEMFLYQQNMDVYLKGTDNSSRKG
ncbi:stage V sporulation protein AA [Alkaliphilus serpentinus]|uniref:Stage V sporulation protein AB n=1 Tax=Alkaliphilus serpentinus TaxID=1482731 RepID=A0A833HQ87_9FIRM|nr:stage V sporulation protein AA [Alkaliphilus serpentinus]KAB3531480.1 stage V sporulation protein AB [Alkaliphilus serpentinus]